MVMVVADTIFETRRRARGLNPPDEPLRGEDGECVVDRLHRDGADFGTDGFGDGVRGDVWMTRNRSQHGQTLSRDLNPVLAEKVCCVRAHCRLQYQILESFQTRNTLSSFPEL